MNIVRTAVLITISRAASGVITAETPVAVSPVDAQWAAAARQRDAAAGAVTAPLRLQVKALKLQRLGVMKAQNPEPSEGAAATAPEPGGEAQPAFFATASLLPLPAADSSVAECKALAPAKVEDLVDQASKAEGVAPDLLRAVMRQESAFFPCAVSQKGALGLMQLMPGTAAALGVADALDPLQNVSGGARLLHSLLNRYAGDLGLTLGAYNAGAAKVDAVGGIPSIPETTNYVRSIFANLGISQEEH